MSNFFILLSIFVTILSFIFPGLISYGINDFYIQTNQKEILIIQFILYQFLHGGIIHILSNSIFIYFFGNIVEKMIGYSRFLIFFIFNTIFVGILLLFFSSGNVIGISGFCMAILSYYTLELYYLKNVEYKSGIMFIFLNIIIGISPGISLFGHLFGVISGIVFYFFNKKVLLKR